MDDHQPVDHDSDDDSSAAWADPSPDQGMHDPLGMQAQPAAPASLQQPSEADDSHSADMLHAQSDAEVSSAELSDAVQPPSVLVPLEQPAQVADECGDGVLHAQSDADAPVAAQVVPTVHGLLNSLTTLIVNNVMSLLPEEALPVRDDCMASSLPDLLQLVLSAAALNWGMLCAQVQPSGLQVLAAAASDRGMTDNVNPSLSHKGASADSCNSMADDVAMLSPAASCPPRPSSVNVPLAPPPPTVEQTTLISVQERVDCIQAGVALRYHRAPPSCINSSASACMPMTSWGAMPQMVHER